MVQVASLNGAERAFGFGPPAKASRRGRAPAALVGDPWISLPLIVLVGAGSLGCFPIWLALTQEISSRHTAVCIGFYGTTAWLVIAASSPVIGGIVDRIGTFVPCLIVVGFVPLIGALTALGWPEPKDVAGAAP